MARPQWRMGGVPFTGDVHQLERYLQETLPGLEQAPSDVPMYWAGAYDGSCYQLGDVVYDSPWLMVANKDTCDRPAPQPVGSPSWALPEAPAWSELSNVSVVYTGHLYTFTQSGWVTSLRVWVPELSPDTNYRFVLVRNPNSAAPIYSAIEEPVLTEKAWTNVALGSSLVLAGEQFLFFIDALNSGSSTPTVGGWLYAGTSNAGAPAAQSWNKRVQNDIVRIDKTDLDSSDRATELLGITAGSTLRFSDSTNPQVFEEFQVTADPTDAGSYIEFPVVLLNTQGTLGTGIATDMDASTPIAQPTQYVELPNHWPANNPAWATVEGFKQFNGVDQPGADVSAFGVDLLFQEGSASEDWDIMSYTGGSAGSGGSGGATWETV